MDFGVSYFPTDEAIEPAELARLCEERGFESVFVTEHSHIPASRETDHPAGGELPREYSRIHDPFVALATMAQATERIRIGTAICLVVQRDPIITAKQVASLDVLSGGRVLFGVGGGWNLEEMANHGTDPGRRFAMLRERIEAIRTIWAEDEASYHGEFVDFERIWSWPKPVQQPGPPVLVGGNGAKVLDRVLAYGDAWFPNRIGAEEHNIPRIEELQRRAAEAGRDPIPVTIQIPPRDPDSLRRYEAAGVTRTVHMLRPEDAVDTASAERKLDEWALRIDHYCGGAA
ncbi:MAG TPA: LLM class F420-dependent oxidoreductase [Solirubrobacterales bacterium]|nr:LLM class F420-dependent oxidoreductase [Solirubrobacterales bacterium]